MKWIHLTMLFILSGCSAQFWTALETPQPQPVSRLCSYYDPYYGIVRYTYCTPVSGYYTYPTYPYPTNYYNPRTVIVVKDKDKPKSNKYTPPKQEQRRSTGVDRSKTQSKPNNNRSNTPPRNIQRDMSKGEVKVETNRSDVKN